MSRSVKLQIVYQTESHEVSPRDIAECGDLNSASGDSAISAAIHAFLGEELQEGAWPAYFIRQRDLDSLIAAVREAIAAQNEGLDS